MSRSKCIKVALPHAVQEWTKFGTMVDPQTHIGPTRVPSGIKTRGYWCVEPATTLIVFVHGFMGGATDTWVQFPRFLPQTAQGRNADIVFYGYDAQLVPSANSAIDFQAFLVELLEYRSISPPKEVVEARGTKSYAQIVIVAHSLGAVVVRRALLYAHAQYLAAPTSCIWLDKVKMILFAPAHLGSHLAYDLDNIVFKHVSLLARMAPAFLLRMNVLGKKPGMLCSPLLAELRPGSTALESLKADTTRALTETPPFEGHLKAIKVIWAQYENVVVTGQFVQDPKAIVIHKTDHQGVCKPTSSTHEAIAHLISVC